MVCGNVGIVQGVAGIVKGEDVVKWYLVKIKKDSVLTNVIVQADSPEEAERKVKEEEE